MSVESEPAVTADETVEGLAQRLGEAIAELPEYEAFEEARAAVEADEELQQQISEFEQLRQEFMLARQAGDATQADVDRVKEAQSDLHGQPAMADYLAAKDRLTERLAELNDAISEPLAVDFGGEAGGCCQD